MRCVFTKRDQETTENRIDNPRINAYKTLLGAPCCDVHAAGQHTHVGWQRRSTCARRARNHA